MLALEDVLNSGGYFYCIFFWPCTSQSSSGWWRTQRTRESSLFWLHMGHRGARWNCQADCPEADDIQMRCRFHSVGFTSTYASSSDPTEYSGNYTQHTGYNPKMTKSRRSSSELNLDTCNTTKHHSSGYREETLPFSLRSTRWRSFRLYPSQLSVNTAKGELAQI